MKRYFTKTGIELIVIQGGQESAPVTQEEITDLMLGTHEMDFKDRFAVGFDLSYGTWFVDDRWSQASASVEYETEQECQAQVDKLNTYQNRPLPKGS
jgi:hypothetical protein